MLCGNLHFKVERKSHSGRMVKILEVEEQPNSDLDEECYEIDPSEFAKKVNLKGTDDVVLVAAKAKIKVEPEDSSKTSGGYGGEAYCSRVRSSGVTHDYRHEFATGDSKDNPCKIDEDEPTLLQMEIDEDRFALDGPSSKIGADDRSDVKFIRDKDGRCFDTNEVSYKIVVKGEPDDPDGVEDVGHHCNKMNSESGADDHKDGQFFRGDKDERHCDTNGIKAIPKGRIFDEDVVVV